MVLTFRSTTPESRTIVEQQPDGRERIAVATRNPAATKFWNLVVRHPSGETWRGTYTGDTSNVVGALDEMLARTENDFKNDAARGDRPRPPACDYNRQVSEGFAPVRPIPGDKT